MGKVKLKKKSTFIDMTAMSDVTVLLLTFFMLTSTFLQKEPTVVNTPSSVSEEKVPMSNLVTILVSAADNQADDPTATEGKIFISFSGGVDSTLKAEVMRGLMLDKAVQIYNEEHQNNKIQLNAEQRQAFMETNMMGVPFKELPKVLSMPANERDKLMSDLKNPIVGIPINGNRDKTKNLNDFQVWCKAIYLVARELNDQDIANLEADQDPKAIENLYNAVTKNGKGIALKADKDTPFTTVQLVFDNLQTMSLNKFSLLTALTSEDEVTTSK